MFAVLCLIVTCNVLPVMMIFLVFLSVFGVGFAVFVAVTVVYLFELLHFLLVLLLMSNAQTFQLVCPHVFLLCAVFCAILLCVVVLTMN